MKKAIFSNRFLRRLAVVGGGIMILFAMPALAGTQVAAVSKNDPHADVFKESMYPSASQCAVCHKQIYKEWASSNHAYASISPMFHKFEQAITNLTQGTIGTFCVRCHQEVGTQMGEKRELPLWKRSRVSSEGVTCITCHRVSEEYGRVNGERTINPGTIHAPVEGSMQDSVFAKVIKDKSDYKIATNDKERGAKIHAKVIRFSQIDKSEFCASCHQVAVNLGIKLEVVWEQYRDSPAAKAGVTCQQCHMGKVPGRADGFSTAPVAVINGKEINPTRPHHNHSFYGPGYPIAHPGIFPHNPDAENWTMQDWLKFDYRAGWGTEEFEDSIADITDVFDQLDSAVQDMSDGKADARETFSEQVDALAKLIANKKAKRVKNALAALIAAKTADPKTAAAAKDKMASVLGVRFPEVWSDAGDREDANDVIQENLKGLEHKKELRREVMENGSRIDGPFFDGTPEAGQALSFKYTITNTDPGHNLPSGSLGAQPEIWFDVALIDPDGKRVWESGYVDSNGDFADIHSMDVAAGKIPFDDQLVNLQTKFLTTNVKGTDREMYLPVNFDIDQRPFLRPINVPASVLNHPPFVRMEARSIPPLGHRDAKYTVPAKFLKKKGKYRLASRMRSRAEPIYFMRFVGATSEMEQSMNQWMLDIHPNTVEFEVK